MFDIHSVDQTLQTVKQVGSQCALIRTCGPPQGKETEEAKGIAEQLGSNFCPVLIGNRKAFYRAQSEGLAVQEFEPDGKAAAEIKALYLYVRDELTKQKMGAGYVKKLA
mgnify:CR=1 FL=1